MFLSTYQVEWRKERSRISSGVVYESVKGVRGEVFTNQCGGDEEPG